MRDTQTTILSSLENIVEPVGGDVKGLVGDDNDLYNRMVLILMMVVVGGVFDSF